MGNGENNKDGEETKEETVCFVSGMKVRSREGCHRNRAGDETGVLDWGNQRKKRSAGNLPCYVAGIFVIVI